MKLGTPIDNNYLKRKIKFNISDTGPRDFSAKPHPFPPSENFMPADKSSSTDQV